MLKNYETVFIMNPVLSTEQKEETVEKFRNLLKNNGSEIVYEHNWGLKKFAYPVQKKTSGFYYLIEFKAPGELIAKLEVEYKRDERIMKFLTVALDKHAVEYSIKKRKNALASTTKEKAVA